MEIKLKEFRIKEIAEGYVNAEDEGCYTFNNRLNIRPPYQREFIYNDSQRDAVIDTIRKGFPLNVMYWVRTAENEVKGDDSTGKYEILDGQQRTISFCEYVHGNFSIKYDMTSNDTRFYHNLTDDLKKAIDDYKIMVYICTGTDDEKMEWFKRINIAGEELTVQEIRNAIHTGSWLYDAKRYFSKNGCLCYRKYEQFMGGKMKRQEWLETALKWISDLKGTTIDEYMALHQQDEDANELWQYFEEVMAWQNRIFPEYKKEMQGIEWGLLFNKYKDIKLNSNFVTNKVNELLADEEVTNRKGIFQYILSGNEKYLNLRGFPESMKTLAYEKQKGNCAICGKHFEYNEMHGDHKKAWSKGGRTEPDNCQMLCAKCNLEKSSNDSGF